MPDEKTPDEKTPDEKTPDERTPDEKTPEERADGKRPVELNGPAELTGPAELNEPVALNEPVELNGPAELNELTNHDSVDLVDLVDIRHPSPVEPYYADFPEQESPDDVAHVDEAAARPPRLRMAAIIGARLVAGSAGAVLAVAVIVAASVATLPNVRAVAPSVLVTPIATEQQLVCSGALLQLSDATGQNASGVSELGPAKVTSAATAGDATMTPFAKSVAGTGQTGSAPQLLSAQPDPTTPVLLSGAQAQNVISGESVGLAAAGCSAAAGDSWLVGGSTTTGRTTLLTMSNPSDVAATVDLEIFGPLGEVSAPGLTGISVPPGSQSVVSLAGFAPEVESPVVHVQSRGGLVVAELQQTVVRGIEPGGVDLVAAGTTPRLVNVIPGVVVSNSAAVEPRLGEVGYADLKTILRMYAPGQEGGSVTVSIQPEDGQTPSTTFDIDVEAGLVDDLPIDNLVDGNYTFTLESEVPIVAAARVSTAGSVAGRTDFAWMTTASLLGSDALVSAPVGVQSTLHLANTRGSAAEITVQALEGDITTVPVASGAAIVVPIAAGESYRLSGVDEVYASITTSVDGGLAGYTVLPPARSSSPIRIYP